LDSSAEALYLLPFTAYVNNLLEKIYAIERF